MTNVTFPYEQLSSMTDGRVEGIWQALITPSCGCLTHVDYVQERTPEFEAWAEAVYGEISVRGLSSELKQEPFVCEQCGGEVIYVPAESGPAAYIVCAKCKTRRLDGDHINCRPGTPEPLPA